MEKITVDNTLLALIIRKNFNREGVNFVTSKENPLQVGVSQYAQGVTIKPHIHKKPLRYIRTTQEILYIVKGKVKVDLFFKNKKVVKKILKEGDAIIFISGGHGFRFLSDAKIFEVKQGPYIDKKSDKRYLNIK